MHMTKALVILLAVAIVLGIVAFFAVFSPGTSVIAGSSNATASGTLSFNGLVNGSGTVPADASGTLTASSTGGPGIFSGGNGSFATNFSYPYVMNWSEGQNDYSITGAKWVNNQLTLALKIQTGNVGGCIPIDVRLVTDESGDVQAPAESQFLFPDTGSCNGTPNKAYENQILDFTIPPNSPVPLLFTTGGTSNQFFQIATTTDGEVEIDLPATSG
jgi:hypothetical protein